MHGTIDPSPSLPLDKPLHAFPSNNQLYLGKQIKIFSTSFRPQTLVRRAKLQSFEIIWPTQGSVECMLGLVATPARPVLLIPGIKYFFRAQNRMAPAIVIQFQVTRYPRTWHAPSFWPNSIDLTGHDICRPLISYLHTHAPHRDPLIIRAALTLLIIAIVTQTAHYTPSIARTIPPLLQKALDYIRQCLDDHLCDRITPTQIAAAIGCCRCTVDNLFKRHLNNTPAAEIMRARLDRAVFFLFREDLPIDIIAALTGFCSSSLLFLHCRQHFGCSPSTLRQHLRNGEKPFPLPISRLLYDIPLSSNRLAEIDLTTITYPPGKHMKDYRARKAAQQTASISDTNAPSIQNAHP